MKKIVLLSLAIAISIGLHAQSNLRFGVEAGLNLSHSTEATAVKCGYNAGVTVDYSITPNWYVDGALKLTLKPWEISANQNFNNFESKQTVNVTTAKNVYNPYSVVLPIHVGYRFNVSNSAKLFVGVGPYVGLGLWGNGTYSYKSTTPALEYTEKISNIYTSNDGKMKRFEVGLTANVGVELKSHYIISMGYDLQANDFSTPGLTSQRAQAVSFNLGYKF